MVIKFVFLITVPFSPNNPIPPLPIELTVPLLSICPLLTYIAVELFPVRFIAPLFSIFTYNVLSYELSSTNAVCLSPLPVTVTPEGTVIPVSALSMLL